jgi:hypothetical protein
MSKGSNGDAQAIWGLVLSSRAARSAKPGSGDGKIANNDQMAWLWEASGYSPLNNAERQFEQEMAGSPACVRTLVNGSLDEFAPNQPQRGPPFALRT